MPEASPPKPNRQTLIYSPHPIPVMASAPVYTMLSEESITQAEAQSEALVRLFTGKTIQHPSLWKTTMNQVPAKRSHVFIVNPQVLVRVGIRTLLESEAEFSVLGEASSRQDALPLIFQLKPDIVILNLRVHDGKAIDTAKELLARLPGTRVLFIADTLDDTILLAAVATGAHGYVLQEAGTGTLLHALRAVSQGQSYLDPGMTRHTFTYLRKLANRKPERGRHLLSPQEQRLLPLIAQGKTNKEIAAELGLSDKTVKNYLANVYTKLRLTRRSQAAAYYLQHLS